MDPLDGVPTAVHFDVLQSVTLLPCVTGYDVVYTALLYKKVGPCRYRK